MADRRRLSSPPPHEHMKNTSTCGAARTENKQETGRKALLQPRLQRKIHTESGVKGGVAIR